MQVFTSLQTDNHASTPLFSFLQAECPSCHPINSIKALKANVIDCNEENSRLMDQPQQKSVSQTCCVGSIINQEDGS